MPSEETRAALHQSLDDALAAAAAEADSLRLQLAAALAERDEALAGLALAEEATGTLRTRVEELGSQSDEWRDRANELHGEVEALKEENRAHQLTIAHKNARLAEIAGEILHDQTAPDDDS